MSSAVERMSAVSNLSRSAELLLRIPDFTKTYGVSFNAKESRIYGVDHKENRVKSFAVDGDMLSLVLIDTYRRKPMKNSIDVNVDAITGEVIVTSGIHHTVRVFDSTCRSPTDVVCEFRRNLGDVFSAYPVRYGSMPADCTNYHILVSGMRCSNVSDVCSRTCR